ncbi:MAG: hypothetical protein ACXWV1_09300, partial [Chitinophagaceae bacterium]
MNFIRLTAFMAVTLIAFACDSKNASQKVLEADIPAKQNEISIAAIANEDDEKAGYEDFYTDTAGRQVQNDKLKQQQPRQHQ